MIPITIRIKICRELPRFGTRLAAFTSVVSRPMCTESLQFLQQLLNTPSPPGYEAEGQRVWLDYVEPFASETYTDAYGNAVAVLNKGGSPRLMLAGHADEI